MMNDASHNTPAMMPLLFIGHGSPMNAIESNRFSLNWQRLGESLPKPKAILCISAHWETRGTQVTAMNAPRTIHDFGGFPAELYTLAYPAPGSLALAQHIQQLITSREVALDYEWGLDHGSWSILRHMYPKADIPVVQLSLDRTVSGATHYALARELLPLRSEGVLIMGCGNLVHNLRLISARSADDFDKPFAFDWAQQATDLFKQYVRERRHDELSDFASLGDAVQMAVPSPEHFLPLLYPLALQQPEEEVLFFNDEHVAGSLSMTSLIIATPSQLTAYRQTIDDEPKI